MSENTTPTRRQFLRDAVATTAATAATVAATSSMPTTAEAMRRIVGANDRLLIGHVGLGGQGEAHYRLLKENAEEGLKNNTQSIACCDLYVRRKKKCQAFLGLQDSQTFDDFHKLIELKDIDAVWVTTSDQWHADIALAAMEAGKHVYIEKPMAKSVEDAFKLWDTAKRTKRVVQVGSQGCSDQKWHVAGKIAKEGKIGHLIVAQGSYMRNGKIGEWNYYDGEGGGGNGPFSPVVKNVGPNGSGDDYINWEMFRKGQGPKEFDPDRFFRWRKYWEYGNGIMGDLFPHRLHPLMIAMNIPQEGLSGFPARVASMGGLYVQKTNPVTGKPDREVPDFTNIIVDFAEPVESSLLLLGSVINEQGLQDMIRFNKATLYFGGSGSVQIKPEEVWANEVEGGTVPVTGWDEKIQYHERNFIDSIRNNTVPNCNIDLAVRVQVMITLGELSYRQGKMMHFDPKTRRYGDKPFTGETGSDPTRRVASR